jgi:hypothetical protein
VASPSRSLLVGALAALLHDVSAGAGAQTPPVAPARPIAIIVLDDTALVDGERSRLAAAGVDALGRAIADSGADAAAVSVGPGGLSVDQSDDPSVVPAIARSIGEGRYIFHGPADDAKAAIALDVTLAAMLDGLARQRRPGVVVVVGRSTGASAERHAQLQATTAAARRQQAKILWLDLEPRGCEPSPRRDSLTLARPDGCGVLTDPASVDRVAGVFRTALGR